MKKTYCDHCEKEIESVGGHLVLKANSIHKTYRGAGGSASSGYYFREDEDFCSWRCLADLLADFANKVGDDK